MSNFIWRVLTMLVICEVLQTVVLYVGAQNCPAVVSCQPYRSAYRCINNQDCNTGQVCCAETTQTVATSASPTTATTATTISANATEATPTANVTTVAPPAATNATVAPSPTNGTAPTNNTSPGPLGRRQYVMSCCTQP